MNKLIEASENFAVSVRQLGRILRDETAVGRFIMRVCDTVLTALERGLNWITRRLQ